MKFADINRQFTEIVAGYLKAGTPSTLPPWAAASARLPA